MTFEEFAKAVKESGIFIDTDNDKLFAPHLADVTLEEVGYTVPDDFSEEIRIHLEKKAEADQKVIEALYANYKACN